MAREPFIFHSPLSPTEAVEVLRKAIDEKRWKPFSRLGFVGDRPLIGEVGYDFVRVEKRKSYRNDFARSFYGRLGPEPGGTRLEGSFKMPVFVKIFMVIWFAFLAGIGGTTVFQTCYDLFLNHHGPHAEDLVGLLVPAGMAIFGIGLLKFGSALSREGERLIVEQLRKALSARIEEAGK